MKRDMTIEYLKCRADLNFEADFGVNSGIDAILTKWDLIFLYLNNGSFSSIIIKIFKNNAFNLLFFYQTFEVLIAVTQHVATQVTTCNFNTCQYGL